MPHSLVIAGNVTRRQSSKDLRDKVVLMTGATGELGRALLPLFLAAGAQVVLSASDARSVHEHAASLDAGARGRVLPLAVDLTEPGAALALRSAALAWRGRIDGLVQAAGYNECNAFADESDELFERILRINLITPAALMKAVLPDMLARGSGVILNVCSNMGLLGYPAAPGYTASKFGLVGLSHALHQEVRSRGVRVHAVCPPGFESPLFRSVRNRPAYYDTVRPLRAETVARAVLGAYGSSRCLHVIGAVNRLSFGLHALFPELTNALIRRVIGY
ncbi:MAG TPA: SDR family NAD(P)-dependent oxidoreductase [Polyangiaceae bacterium]|nr:SDR family NAD(P)-dependent oxidoreductase [Polyangiaceae bacterium]